MSLLSKFPHNHSSAQASNSKEIKFSESLSFSGVKSVYFLDAHLDPLLFWESWHQDLYFGVPFPRHEAWQLASKLTPNRYLDKYIIVRVYPWPPIDHNGQIYF